MLIPFPTLAHCFVRSWGHIQRTSMISVVDVSPVYSMSFRDRTIFFFFFVSFLFPPRFYMPSGIVFSSLGAAMQCLVGASRLVAAIANDHTIPLLRPFAPKPDEEPSKALYLVWVLASLPCLAGNLDYITPVMTMFFLLM